FVGALYLIFLGVRALSSRPQGTVASQLPHSPPPSASAWPNLRDGFVVALFNPKTALFFAAFLPQFMDPSGSAMMESVMLGALFVAVAASTDAVYVMVATAAQARLGRIVSSGRIGRYLTASTFIGLGIYTAFASPRAAK
ncbi:MAG TPA: LysE family translocator, partial [Lautropia sp.]|nr:LysE family translocator [Lautropia sp.]